MSKPRVRVSAELCGGSDSQVNATPAPVHEAAASDTGMIMLAEEFTQPALRGVYEAVSAQRKAGTFVGLDGTAVKRTDGAGVQFLLVCFSAANEASDGTAGVGGGAPPGLIASERLLGAIAALGATQSLAACLAQAPAESDTDLKLAA